MWTAQKDAFRRKVADSEAENIVSVITLTFLFMFVSHQTSLELCLPLFFVFFCSDFWPNWPTKRRNCPNLLRIWTLKRFEPCDWYYTPAKTHNRFFKIIISMINSQQKNHYSLLPSTGKDKDDRGARTNPAVDSWPSGIRAEQNGEWKSPSGCSDSGLGTWNTRWHTCNYLTSSSCFYSARTERELCWQKPVVRAVTGSHTCVFKITQLWLEQNPNLVFISFFLPLRKTFSSNCIATVTLNWQLIY